MAPFRQRNEVRKQIGVLETDLTAKDADRPRFVVSIEGALAGSRSEYGVPYGLPAVTLTNEGKSPSAFQLAYVEAWHDFDAVKTTLIVGNFEIFNPHDNTTVIFLEENYLTLKQDTAVEAGARTRGDIVVFLDLPNPYDPMKVTIQVTIRDIYNNEYKGRFVPRPTFLVIDRLFGKTGRSAPFLVGIKYRNET